MASVERRHRRGRAASTPARTSSKSQINWAVAGGQAGSTVKPFALAAGLKAGYSLKDTFDGNSPFELDDGTEIRNEGDDETTAPRSTCIKAHRGLHQHRVHRPDRLDARRARRQILDMMNAMGIPPNKGPGKHLRRSRGPARASTPTRASRSGSATISPINMANAYATIANGGRFDEPFIIEKVDGHGRRGPLRPLGQRQAGDRRGPGRRHRRRRQSYALQQVVAGRHRHGRARRSTARPPARPAPRPTTSDQVASAWFTGYTPAAVHRR